ncbi:MAG: hypothetical protein A3B37_02500 [Candidatus Sungbacteria bacterium RIFCSPLOWO2_01_FULL_59_16]|uniref:AB hydrolase-1 domain-containing protein n=1 Tax=Candidatus Sungbacteria bacterium RIFCSPLOWO2_01_FULL_59_16 TaxID=1802280 RepID=A0A1G2LCQ9_9BACT|nr:MAG: hypothetical protein A3B37_02500 [Candidatus Sungbacteria bacterium RIFCSPLOWO2_01_FULL_59_16]
MELLNRSNYNLIRKSRESVPERLGRWSTAKKIGTVALFVVLGFAWFSFYLFWGTVRPGKAALGGTPEQYFLNAERVSVTAADRVRLSGWLIPRAERSGNTAIILLHGYPAAKSDLLPLAAAMHPHFATLLLDMRYFGESGGRMTTLGFRERKDIQKAVDLLASRGYAKIGVFGVSLGGAVGFMAAAEDARIGAVAAYAPFSDLGSMADETYGRFGPLRIVLTEPMFLWARLFFGEDPRIVSPFSVAPGFAKPVFLVHNRPDEQISFRNAQRLEVALRGNPYAEFYFPESGGHQDIPADLYPRLIDFFSRSLGAADRLVAARDRERPPTAR